MTKTEAIQALVAEIAAYQEKHGLTDLEVAAELGVPRSSWSVWKNRLQIPGIGFAVKMTRVRRFQTAATKVLEAS